MRAVVICAVLAIVPPVARAAGPDTEADALIARGLELRRQEKPIDALDLFQRAHAIAPSPRTLGQMGLVEASLQLWAAAEDHVSAALATPSDPWVRKNSGFLTRALATAKGHIGELEIIGPAGTEISIDGKPAGSLPAIHVMRRSEGQVVVTASGPGFKDFAKTVSIAGGARTSLAVVLDPVDSRPAAAVAPPVALPPPPPPPVPEHQPRFWKTWTGGALVAAGAGLLAWGIVWIAVDGNNACSSVSGPDCEMVYDTRRAGWMLTGSGAAVISAGTILLLTGRTRSNADVAVGFTPTSLLLQGRF